MTNYINRTQSGRSMIEMLGVLAIVGILSAGGIAGYSMAMQSYKTSALSEKVQMIAQQTRVLYDGVYTDAEVGDSSSGLIGAGLINDAKNAFGGDLVVDAGPAIAGVGAAGDTFTVYAENVPKEACVKLLRADWGNSGVFAGVAVGTEVATAPTFTPGGTTAATKSPVAASNAITACGESTQSITWFFK